MEVGDRYKSVIATMVVVLRHIFTETHVDAVKLCLLVLEVVKTTVVASVQVIYNVCVTCATSRHGRRFRATSLFSHEVVEYPYGGLV